jgi:hypothetical protein
MTVSPARSQLNLELGQGEVREHFQRLSLS